MTSTDPAIYLKELKAELKEKFGKEIELKAEVEVLKSWVKRKEVKI
jgi:hypothetical protein